MSKLSPGLASFALAAAFGLAPALRAAADLAAEPSAFLRTYADTAVKWELWGDAAFARARSEHKPVYLAVGLFTSELSRAMARQSFANVDVAALLNENFVCILADAREVPALTSLGQNYLGLAKQLRGLPLNLFLTPELEPFEGANYLPPTEEWGKEGLINVVKRVLAAWKADPAAQRRKAAEAVAAVRAGQPAAPAAAVDADVARTLAEGVEAWRARFDAAHGGFGDPPKYPEPELLRALLRDPATRDMALATLRAIAQGALRDPLDGGFFRYALDAEWRQPYFQKTLVDQARLALALLDAARLGGDARFADAARGALAYALDRLADGKGDFANAEDATREDAAASFFWSLDEIRDAVGAAEADEFARAHGATAEGNVPADAFPGVATKGKNLLSGPGDAPAGKDFAAARAKLLAQRLRRPAPHRDSAATAGVHGLLLAALVRAGAELPDERFAAAATAQVAFIRARLLAPDGSLRRLADRAIPAAPDDYALVADGLLVFHATTGNASARSLARQLLVAAGARFWDPAAGRFFTSEAAPAPGFWARVHAAQPSAGDPPSADPAMLFAIVKEATSDQTLNERKRSLLSALVADSRDSADALRGDALLALSQSLPVVK